MNGHGEHFEHGLRDLIGLAHDHGEGKAIVEALMGCVPEYVPLDKQTPLEQQTIEKPAVLV